MTSAERALLERAAKLTPKAKLRVARALVASATEEDQDDIDTRWIAMVERRVDDMLAGKAKMTPWPEVLAKLRARKKR